MIATATAGYRHKMLTNDSRIGVKSKGRRHSRPAEPILNWSYCNGEPVPLREGLVGLRTNLYRAGDGYGSSALKAVGNELAEVVIALDGVIDHPALDSLDPEDEEVVRGLAATWNGAADELKYEFRNYRPYGRKSFDSGDVPMVRDALAVIAGEMEYVVGELDKVAESHECEGQ